MVRGRFVFPVVLSMVLGLGCAESSPPAQQWDAAQRLDASANDTSAGDDAAPCWERCMQGQRQCTAGGYQECGNFDSDSCLEWGPVTPCQAGEKCVEGQCQVTCTSECNAGQVRCTADGTGTESCEDGTGGCRVWGAPVACPGGETCSGGVCSSTCQDECSSGSRQCAGDGYQACGQYDGDACLDWGPVTACPSGETCSNGACRTTCTSECTAGAKRCASTSGVQECGDFDSDPCLEWSAVTPCPTGQTCSNGQCSATCNDECEAEHDTQCTPSGTGYQECGDYNQDGCLEWGAQVDCGQNETCDHGECVFVCDCDFFSDVCEPIAPGTTTPCDCDPDCAGGATPCSSDYHCDTWCPTDVDPDCGCSCNYNEYCEADIDYNDQSPPPDYGDEQICACDPDCEPHDYACMDDGHCDTWCLPEHDPDCQGADPCRDRGIYPGMSIGWRYGQELYLDGAYEADADYADAVLLSPGLSGGSGEIFVEFAAEHLSCVDSLVMEVLGYDDSIFGDGAEMYLYNWETYQFDLLPDWTVGHTADDYPEFFQNYVTDYAPYLLCGTGDHAKCWVDAKVDASAWDNTHVLWVELYVHTIPGP